MMLEFSSRSSQKEHLDDFEIGGAEYRQALKHISQANNILGGTASVIGGLSNLLKDFPNGSTISICDLGCGDASVLQEIENSHLNKKYKLELIGIDGNEDGIAFAKAQLKQSNITLKHVDFFTPEFDQIRPDIFISVLTFHHLSDTQIITLLKKMKQQSKIGFLISDLHRSRLAHVGFKGFSKIFKFNNIARHDGLVSIRRSFTKSDWNYLLEQAGIGNAMVAWQWAFRFIVSYRK